MAHMKYMRSVDVAALVWIFVIGSSVQMGLWFSIVNAHNFHVHAYNLYVIVEVQDSLTPTVV